MKEADYLEGEQFSPFSNGTEAMDWHCNNCCRCTRAHKPKDPNDPPSFNATIKLVNIGMECKMKLAVDFGFITGTISVEMAKLIGIEYMNNEPYTLKEQCLMFSDDDKDGWHPKYKPKEPPDNQMCLPFALNEIVKDKVKELV